MHIRNAHPGDAAEIAEIYNEAVRNTTAIWNETEVDVANRAHWIADRQAQGFPVLVAVGRSVDGGPEPVLGFASYGPWRPHQGYRLTVEHSVYVHTDRRGDGLGRKLLEALIAEATVAGLHVMVAAIEAGNTGSIALHRKLGFVETGRMAQVGCKFGRWLDLAFLQLRLDDRPTPD